MENSQGLSKWEWNMIKNIPADVIRKRFRDELDHQSRVGNLLEALKDDNLLTHVLAYAWKSTYHIALVCKRLWIITRSRIYWSNLAKHALKHFIPQNILNQVNFFHLMEDNVPSRMRLQGLLKRKNLSSWMKKRGEYLELYYPHPKGFVIFDLSWARMDGESNDFYSISHSIITDTNKREHVLMERRRVEYFNHSRWRKLEWEDRKLFPEEYDGKEIPTISTFHYCEIFDPQRGQTWYGQPGIHEKLSNLQFDDADCLPGPQSWGVWK